LNFLFQDVDFEHTFDMSDVPPVSASSFVPATASSSLCTVDMVEESVPINKRQQSSKVSWKCDSQLIGISNYFFNRLILF